MTRYSSVVPTRRPAPILLLEERLERNNINWPTMREHPIGFPVERLFTRPAATLDGCGWDR